MYGNQLKALRESFKLGKKELAKQIGTSHQNITRWENNEVSPNIIFCVKLADFYEITLDELIGRTNKKNW